MKKFSKLLLLFCFVFLFAIFKNTKAKEKLPDTIGIYILPKSGTVMLSNFFSAYFYLLENPQGDVIKFLTERESFYFDASKFNKYSFIGHGSCPGFESYIKNKKDSEFTFKKWRKLKYFTSGWTPNKKHIHYKKVRSLMSEGNKNFKLVFVYRNPLDQLVSYYYHNKKSTYDDHLYTSKNTNGKTISLRDFIFKEEGAKSYIKQYYTFFYMKNFFPKNLLMITYYELVKNRKKTLLKILQYIGLQPMCSKEKKAFEKALDATSLESTIKIERTRKTPSTPDIKPGQQHIQSGVINRYKKENIDADDILKIKKQFILFGIPFEKFFH